MMGLELDQRSDGGAPQYPILLLAHTFGRICAEHWKFSARCNDSHSQSLIPSISIREIVCSTIAAVIPYPLLGSRYGVYPLLRTYDREFIRKSVMELAKRTPCAATSNLNTNPKCTAITSESTFSNPRYTSFQNEFSITTIPIRLKRLL